MQLINHTLLIPYLIPEPKLSSCYKILVTAWDKASLVPVWLMYRHFILINNNAETALLQKLLLTLRGQGLSVLQKNLQCL